MEPETGIPVKYRFGVRRRAVAGLRGSGLLILDRSGIYSSARRRYIRMTRYHRYRALAAELAPLVKAYRALQKLGMNSWPEHDEEAREEITWWKHMVMDAYWDVAPGKHKASATERYFRARYQRGTLYPFLGCVAAAIVGGGLLRLMLHGRFEASFRLLCLLLVCCLLAWVLVVLVERFVTIRWALIPSGIHDLLEFELTK